MTFKLQKTPEGIMRSLRASNAQLAENLPQGKIFRKDITGMCLSALYISKV